MSLAANFNDTVKLPALEKPFFVWCNIFDYISYISQVIANCVLKFFFVTMIHANKRRSEEIIQGHC